MSTSQQRVGEWMTGQPHTIGDDQSLAEARERMHHWQVRHLPVLHGGHLVGIVSDRDIALVESIPSVDIASVRVEEAMTQEPWTVGAGASLREVATHMAEQRIGTAIIVADDNEDSVVGVFTTTDALRALAQLCA
ncbi:CBS domain-containing protein [Pseudenhygromyxa sp. WMMC2535]|uniref:CBS domain-containing protein n=1 Tax=Pseudenhygromyxa sp. WMMC2535 TaxID=2712867 RepID=UPI0015531BB7|nr:CBS domain-containing protein [Pseudenhygromyxa sp. WMMC2535]NVB37364.1 CBS domain-containing protein [Pseudenhygromyxa sp. WMMC2535]